MRRFFLILNVLLFFFALSCKEKPNPSCNLDCNLRPLSTEVIEQKKATIFVGQLGYALKLDSINGNTSELYWVCNLPSDFQQHQLRVNIVSAKVTEICEDDGEINKFAKIIQIQKL